MALAQQSKALLSLDQLNIPKVAHIAIVSTEWNDTLIAELLKGATTIFQQFPQIQITHYTVPGCVELNYALKKITTTQSVDAAIAFGAVIRGGTPHFDYVCQSVTQGITQLNTEGTVPVIFGVLTLDNEAQAWERLGGTHGHKGEEAAIAALKMIQYKRLA